MFLNLHLDWLGDSDNDNDDNCDEASEEDIIQEALRMAQELKAQKEQPLKCQKVSEKKPTEMKRDGPTASQFAL